MRWSLNRKKYLSILQQHSNDAGEGFQSPSSSSLPAIPIPFLHYYSYFVFSGRDPFGGYKAPLRKPQRMSEEVPEGRFSSIDNIAICRERTETEGNMFRLTTLPRWILPFLSTPSLTLGKLNCCRGASMCLLSSSSTPQSVA